MIVRTSSLVCFALSFALTVSALPARAQDALPSPVELQARIDAARGTAPASSREVEETTEGGLVIRSTVVNVGHDYLNEEGDGPLHQLFGRYGDQRWRQNTNGQTILMQPDPERVAPEPKVDTVARITTPVDGYLFSSLDAHGLGTKRYIEATTWRVVRQDDIRASLTRVTTYEDFRTIAGYTQPFYRKSTDGRAENDSVTRVISYDPAPLPRSAVAIPGTRRALVEFPAGKTSVMLPVRYRDGNFIVRIMVGQRGLDFVLDSGAAGIVMQDSVAKQLGLVEYGSFSNGANAGRYRESYAIVPQMTVGELAMKDVAIATVPSALATGADFKAVGLLGFDFIGDVALKLDYRNGTVTAYDSDSFVPPAAPEFTADVRLGDGQPVTTVSINGFAGERFAIDTGADGALMIFDRFARRYRRALVDEGGGGDLRYVHFEGVGGDFDVTPYQLKSVRLGGVDFQHFVAYVVRERKLYDQDVDGLIGIEFLKLFDVYFDYAYSKVYFVANDLGNMSRRAVPRRAPTPAPSAAPTPPP